MRWHGRSRHPARTALLNGSEGFYRVRCCRDTSRKPPLLELKVDDPVKGSVWRARRLAVATRLAVGRRWLGGEYWGGCSCAREAYLVGPRVSCIALFVCPRNFLGPEFMLCSNLCISYHHLLTIVTAVFAVNVDKGELHCVLFIAVTYLETLRYSADMMLRLLILVTPIIGPAQLERCFSTKLCSPSANH